MNSETIQEKPEVITDFGSRKVNTQNFSKTVVLPKQALSNCGCNLKDDLKVVVQLVQRDGEKFIKLIPMCASDDEGIEENE